jgi:F0F1-type ATP synthase delta subunit
VIETWLDGKKPTIESLERLIDYLKQLKLPTVHLTLAGLPNHTQRVQLVDWFRATVGQPVLVSFVADRSLGGGVMVRTPNRIFDYSWRQRLTEGRAHLAEIIHAVR